MFVLFLGELVLLIVAIILGPSLGYRFTFAACFWLGVILAAVFASIFFANVAVIFLRDKYRNRKRTIS